MQMSDLDWRAIMSSWPEADIRYLRSICDEKLNQIAVGTVRRKTIIRGEG
jgi:hypothetical protein